MGQDPIEVAPNVYTVLFENERVRLLDARVRPGDGSELHSHPDYLVYNLTDSRVVFSDASGQSQEIELKAGDVMWREAEDHAARNPGDSELHALLFELK